MQGVPLNSTTWILALQGLPGTLCGRLRTEEVLTEICIALPREQQRNLLSQTTTKLTWPGQIEVLLWERVGMRESTLRCVYVWMQLRVGRWSLGFFIGGHLRTIWRAGLHIHMHAHAHGHGHIHTGCPHPCQFLPCSTSYSLTTDVSDILDTWQSFSHVPLFLVTRAAWLSHNNNTHSGNYRPLCLVKLCGRERRGQKMKMMGSKTWMGSKTCSY